MTKKIKTFVDKCLAGEAKPEEIDDYVEIWHKDIIVCELHEFLGMTLNEYAQWVNNASYLNKILDLRKNPLDKNTWGANFLKEIQKIAPNKNQKM